MKRPLTGKVKWYCDTLCYGLITPDNGGEDVIVHKWSIHSKGFPSLDDGQAVEFQIKSSNTNPKKAVEVAGPGGTAVQGNDCSGGKLGDGIDCREYGYFAWANCPQYDSNSSTCLNCGGVYGGGSGGCGGVLRQRARCLKCSERRHICEVRITGKVNWYCRRRGYGFITPDEGIDREDAFVHVTALRCLGFPKLSVGDEVEFQFTVDDKNRKKAFDVTAPGGVALMGSTDPIQSNRK